MKREESCVCGTKELETERLRLRRFRKSDAEMMYRNWAGDDEVTKYLTWRTHADIHASEEYLEFLENQYLRSDFFDWCVELKETGEAIGSIGCNNVADGVLMIGWSIGRAYWGNGYVPEGARAIFRYLFAEAGIQRIETYHHIENGKSGRVMQKLGMRCLGELKNEKKDHDGNPIDVVCYEMTQEEFLNGGKSGD